MKLLRTITENISFKKDPYKNYFIEGIFMQADVVNRNGRRYPEKILDQACEEYLKEYVEKNRAYGELSHPQDDPNTRLERVSHLIVELRKDGKNWYGKAKILDTDMGKIVKAIIDGGGKLAVSSRALGSLRNDGKSDVVDDLKLLSAADIVAEPSAPEAFVEAVMEDVEWVYDSRKKQYVSKSSSVINEENAVKSPEEILLEKEEKIKQKIAEIYTKEIEDFFYKLRNL